MDRTCIELRKGNSYLNEVVPSLFDSLATELSLVLVVRQAASLSAVSIPYASSGVRPPKVECGRRAL